MSPSQSSCFQLEGVYANIWRTSKFKTKGIVLAVDGQEMIVSLPKPLRVLLVNELQPGDRLCILAEQKKDKIVAVNIMKVTPDLGVILSDVTPDRPVRERLDAPPRPSETVRSAPVVSVCKKGTCRKRGSLDLLEQWQTERDHDPSLAGIECRLTGCLKACKSGVNVRVGDRVISHAQNLSLSAAIERSKSH